jgi:hypothetical protein
LPSIQNPLDILTHRHDMSLPSACLIKQCHWNLRV